MATHLKKKWYVGIKRGVIKKAVAGKRMRGRTASDGEQTTQVGG